MSQDRSDIAFAAKELARGMAKPTRADMARLTKCAKFLVGRHRYVVKYRWQEGQRLEVWTDSDWAGDRETRKSTSGGRGCCTGERIR